MESAIKKWGSWVFFFWLYYTVCRILVPDQRLNIGPSLIRAPSPNHWTTREFPESGDSNPCSTTSMLNFGMPRFSPSAKQRQLQDILC